MHDYYFSDILGFMVLSMVVPICSGAVTVASADEVTGVWSINHILQLSSQQVAGTMLQLIATLSYIATTKSLQIPKW